MLKRVKIFLDFLYENIMRIFKDFISNLFCYDILENIESKILSEKVAYSSEILDTNIE